MNWIKALFNRKPSHARQEAPAKNTPGVQPSPIPRTPRPGTPANGQSAGGQVAPSTAPKPRITQLNWDRRLAPGSTLRDLCESVKHDNTLYFGLEGPGDKQICVYVFRGKYVSDVIRGKNVSADDMAFMKSCVVKINDSGLENFIRTCGCKIGHSESTANEILLKDGTVVDSERGTSEGMPEVVVDGPADAGASGQTAPAGPVYFVEVQRLSGMGQTATKELYRADSKTDALRFLKTQRVSRPYYYIEVKAGHRIYGLDVDRSYEDDVTVAPGPGLVTTDDLHSLTELLENARKWGAAHGMPTFRDYPQFQAIRVSGECISQSHGIDGMRQVATYFQVRNDDLRMVLEQMWDGIGDWRA